MQDCIGIVNVEALNYRNEGFLDRNTIASLPFAGKYKVIDFTLSNFVNSGIKNISVFSEDRYRELTEHIGHGKGWGGNVEKFNISFYYPENCNKNILHMKGDIDNFYQNLYYLKKSKENHVLISKTKIICNLDLEKPFKYHKESNADITMVYKKVKNEDKYNGLELLDISPNNNVNLIRKKENNKNLEDEINLSMGMYFMKKEKLIKLIEEAVDSGKEKNLKEALISNLEKYNISSYEYKDYFASAHTLESFYHSNMEMIDGKCYSELFHRKRQILTKTYETSSTIYGKESEVKNSILANGCNIKGKVKNSIVFHGTKISKDAVLSNSLIGKDTILSKTLNITTINR